MVKLIAADMDGTLLDDQKRLPNGFPKLLECLAKRGVAFAVASGRSYPALQMLFGKKTEELLLICEWCTRADSGESTCLSVYAVFCGACGIRPLSEIAVCCSGSVRSGWDLLSKGCKISI